MSATETKTETKPDAKSAAAKAAVAALRAQWSARKAALGRTKGKKVDDLAIEFVVGAANGWRIANPGAESSPFDVLAYLMQVRGASELERGV